MPYSYNAIALIHKYYSTILKEKLLAGSHLQREPLSINQVVRIRFLCQRSTTPVRC